MNRRRGCGKPFGIKGNQVCLNWITLNMQSLGMIRKLPFMLLSASVNSISSIPSPVYQCKKALRLNMAVNCSEIRRNNSWIAVEFPIKVPAILSPRGGMSHTAVFTLFGTHSTKYELEANRKVSILYTYFSVGLLKRYILRNQFCLCVRLWM